MSKKIVKSSERLRKSVAKNLPLRAKGAKAVKGGLTSAIIPCIKPGLIVPCVRIIGGK